MIPLPLHAQVRHPGSSLLLLHGATQSFQELREWGWLPGEFQVGMDAEKMEGSNFWPPENSRRENQAPPATQEIQQTVSDPITLQPWSILSTKQETQHRRKSKYK